MSTLGYTYSDASAVPTSTTTRAAAAAAAGGGGGGGGVRPLWPGGCAGRGRAALRPGSRVCWMLFEYCDKGVLGDGVLRGWFRTRPSATLGAPHLRVIGLTALEIAVAMHYLHGQGIMHGDLCGGNVMLAKSATSPHGFTAKVGDFGLARINRDGAAAACAAGSSGAAAGGAQHPVDQRLGSNEYGTITHMSPEVLLDGGAAFTPAADVYSWGVLLWEMLTGSRAYAGMAAPAVVCQVAVLKRGLAIPKNLPAAVEDLLRRALSPEPEVRPSFAEIVTALTQFVQQSRAVDWEQWQAAVEAAHAEGRATAAATAAAVEASTCGDAAAGCPCAAAARCGFFIG
ncbi:kinase-like domain-containing protein [Scenedesmus sp. NREL 46B-D3]|nr:kinase-like domain-containing protein [Scenedesmus sp. NREL 46B-D3]